MIKACITIIYRLLYFRWVAYGKHFSIFKPRPDKYSKWRQFNPNWLTNKIKWPVNCKNWNS